MVTPVALLARPDRVFVLALGGLGANIVLNLALVPSWGAGLGATGAALAAGWRLERNRALDSTQERAHSRDGHLQFIRDFLGPALRKAGLKTRIWCYDHNFNRTPATGEPGLAYPRSILRDPAAARFVD